MSAKIQFPCELAVKVIAQPHENFIDFLQQTAVSHCPDQESTIASVKESRTAKYSSVTIKIMASDKEQLDGFYQALKQNKNIVFAL